MTSPPDSSSGSSSSAALPEQEQQEDRRRAFAFLLAATDAALQQGRQLHGAVPVLSPSPSPLACVLAATGALLTSPLALSAAAHSAPAMDEKEDAEVAAHTSATAGGKGEEDESPLLTPFRLAALLRAIAAVAAAANEGDQADAAVAMGVLSRLLQKGGVVSHLLLEHEEGNGDFVLLWEAVEGAALLPLTRRLPALVPSSSPSSSPPSVPPLPPLPASSSSPCCTPLLLALPPLCPPALRNEALPRLAALGLR